MSVVIAITITAADRHLDRCTSHGSLESEMARSECFNNGVSPSDYYCSTVVRMADVLSVKDPSRAIEKFRRSVTMTLLSSS